METTIWLVLVGSLFGLLLMGAWIGVALGLSAFLIMTIWGGGSTLMGGQMWQSLNMYGFTAVPAFVFMGELILRSGLSDRAYDCLSPFMARMPGKMLQSNIVMCTIFAAVFGSSTACAAAVGSVAIPELRRRNYNENLILGSICVAGTLAFMIPPSSQFVLYGTICHVSIADLFAGGTIPGLMLSAMFLIYIGIQAKLTPSICPDEEVPLPWGQTLKKLLGLWPIVVIMVACVLPIYAGWCTTTESAGIGTFFSILMGVTCGHLNPKSTWVSCKETTRVMCMLFFIIIGAMALSTSISSLGVPRHTIDAILGLHLSKFWLLAIIYVLYLFLGCLFDGISMMLMTLPFISPITEAMGYDPVWFGIMLCLMIEIAMVTPPVGMNLYIIKSIAGVNPRTGKETAVWDIFYGASPFLICCIILLIMITVWPDIVTWLPNKLRAMQMAG
jgi:C4-dicarboxylate transporter DctM subunit